MSGMTGLVRSVAEWSAAQRAGVTDVTELARLKVVEVLAVRWARVVVSTKSGPTERVAASRELRAILASGIRKAQDDRTGPDPVPGVGFSVGDELAALYGPLVAVG